LAGACSELKSPPEARYARLKEGDEEGFEEFYERWLLAAAWLDCNELYLAEAFLRILSKRFYRQ